MTANDPVLASLELLEDDITRPVYERFAGACPQWAALMDHMDGYMLGRMMGDVATLLMTPPEEIDLHYLGFEVDSHRAYGVTPDMFPPFLETVRETVREMLGSRWTDAMDQAWRQRIAALADEIEEVATADMRT